MSDAFIFRLYRGDDFVARFQVKDINGNGVDISAWGLEVTLKQNPLAGDEDAVVHTPSLPVEPADATIGVFYLDLPKETTGALQPSVYYLNLRRRFNGTESTLLNGRVQVMSEAQGLVERRNDTVTLQLDPPEGSFILEADAVPAETYQTLIEVRDTSVAAKNTAVTKAGEASASATSASDSASLAGQYEANAGDYADAALVSQQAAYTSQTASKASEDASAASASAAAQSETNASNSAASAATDAQTATTKAGEAAGSATAASNSASAAQTAEANTLALFDQFGDQYLGAKTSDPATDNDGNALADGAVYFNTTEGYLKFYSGSAWVAPEDVATTAASNASASAQAAGTSESNAAASASAAATSEANASDSESNAADSASSAAASLADFLDRYHGPSDAPPATNVDEGDLYFDTGLKAMQVYTGTEWVNTSSVVEGIRAAFEYVTGAGQTVFSGVDRLGETMVFDTSGSINVYRNGVRLAKEHFTADPVANEVTVPSIVEGDILLVEAFGNFTESQFALLDPRYLKTADVATTQEAKDAVAGKFPDAAGVYAAFGQYGLGGDLPEIADIDNTALKSGSYYFSGSALGALPPGTGPSGGDLEIAKDPVYGLPVQKAYIFVGAPTEVGIFVRRYIAGSSSWSDWKRVYHQGSILGPVSQSNGIPTGAIIERGSNANGEYVKFADGTLECWRFRFALPYYSNTELRESWTFPVSFAGIPTLSVTNDLYASSAGFSYTESYHLSNSVDSNIAAIRAVLANAVAVPGDAMNFSVIAKGRWY